MSDSNSTSQADPTPVLREPRNPPEPRSNYHVDAELHQEIERFYKDINERQARDLSHAPSVPTFEARSMNEKYFFTASVAFSGGWFIGKYREFEFGFAISRDGSGGFFKTDTVGGGFGLPVGGAVVFGFTQAKSADGIEGKSANAEIEIGKLGFLGSMSPGETFGEYEYSGGISLGIGPNMPFSVGDTKVETFHDIHEKLERTIDRFSGSVDVNRWLGK